MSVVKLSGRCLPLLAAIAAVFLTVTASAQSTTTWTEPNGRFTLDFAASGWTELPPPDNDPSTLLGIEHQGFQEAGGMRACFITEHRQRAGRPVTQEQMNTITRQLGPDGIERATGAAPESNETFELGGIAVIRATVTNRWRQHLRLFYLAEGDGFRQIFINCGATPPVSAEESDNIEAMLQSLRFTAH